MGGRYDDEGGLDIGTLIILLAIGVTLIMIFVAASASGAQ